MIGGLRAVLLCSVGLLGTTGFLGGTGLWGTAGLLGAGGGFVLGADDSCDELSDLGSSLGGTYVELSSISVELLRLMFGFGRVLGRGLTTAWGRAGLTGGFFKGPGGAPAALSVLEFIGGGNLNCGFGLLAECMADGLGGIVTPAGAGTEGGLRTGLGGLFSGFGGDGLIGLGAEGITGGATLEVAGRLVCDTAGGCWCTIGASLVLLIGAGGGGLTAEGGAGALLAGYVNTCRSG